MVDGGSSGVSRKKGPCGCQRQQTGAAALQVGAGVVYIMDNDRLPGRWWHPLSNSQQWGLLLVWGRAWKPTCGVCGSLQLAVPGSHTAPLPFALCRREGVDEGRDMHQRRGGHQ